MPISRSGPMLVDIEAPRRGEVMPAPTTSPLATDQAAAGLALAAPRARELAARQSDGIHVRLLWHPREDAVTVSVADSRDGRHFDFAVARDRAMEAFYHPFAYAA
jgi:hypothetical protein